MIIDSQIHAYEANTPKRPWASVPNSPPSATGDEHVAAMDKLGVGGAIFVSSFSMYQYDSSYAVEVQKKHPGRFALVKPVDQDDPQVEDVIAEWKKTPGTTNRSQHGPHSCSPITKVEWTLSKGYPPNSWKFMRLTLSSSNAKVVGGLQRDRLAERSTA